MSRTDEELRKAEISTVAGELHYQFPRGIDPVAYSDAARHALDAVFPDHDRQLLEAVAAEWELAGAWNRGETEVSYARFSDWLRGRAAALAAPVEPLCDCPPATQDPSGDYCLNCGHLILAAARP